MRLRTILIVLIIVAAAAAGGYWYYQQQTNSARAATATRSTATITRGTLVASVSGAGNVYAPQQTALSFQLTGVTITKVNVHVGDRVKAGDVLAQVDDTDLQLSLKTATANLTSAQAKLDALKQPPNEADVAAARASVASAQSAYNAAVAKNAHNADQITVAKASLDKAIITLQQAQAAFDRIAWRSDAGNSSQAATLQQATIDYQSALANYNITLATINDSAVKSASQQLVQANTTLTKLLEPAAAQDLQVAQATVDQAQIALDQARRKLDQAKIIAPFDGTIAAVNYVVGQLAPAGTVMTLVNLDNLQTQITLSEVDIAKVKKDQEVSLSFDALSGRAVTGKVLSISPIGTVTQGVVNYAVTVALTKPDPAILPGMTAAANITVDRHDNVLLAPNRAVKTQGNQRVVTILFEGKEIPIVVRVGLNNDQNTEILSASSTDGQSVSLQEGDVVVLNPTTTTNTRGGAGVGGFFMGRPD